MLKEKKSIIHQSEERKFPVHIHKHSKLMHTLTHIYFSQFMAIKLVEYERTDKSKNGIVTVDRHNLL